MLQRLKDWLQRRKLEEYKRVMKKAIEEYKDQQASHLSQITDNLTQYQIALLQDINNKRKTIKELEAQINFLMLEANRFNNLREDKE